MGDWHKENLKFEGFGRSISKICIIYILRNRLQSTYVALIRFGKGNNFGGEPIGRAEVEVRVGKLKNGKAPSKGEITGEIIKGGDDRVVDWI